MKPRVEMNSARALRYSAGARALCEAVGNRVAARANAELKFAHGRAGKQFVMDSRAGVPRPWGRWRVSVVAVGPYAREHNARHQTLLRALQGR